MAPRVEVVITGVGVVSPIGIGKEAFFSSIDAQRSGVSVLAVNQEAKAPCQIGAIVDDFEPKKYVRPRKSLKVMCREIQLAFAAADLAVNDSNLDVASVDLDRMGVVFGSEIFYGDTTELIDVYRSCADAGRFVYDRWGEQSMKDMFPLWMLKYLPNMAACHIGISQGARGPNNTITYAEVSSLLAISEACHAIQRGAADIMLSGGVGSQVGLAKSLYRGSELLAPTTGQPEAASRPFDLRRQGMVNGEGAGAVVLERREHAEARGATLYAVVAGHGNAGCRDEETMRIAAIKQTINAALRSADCQANELSHVNAHGLGAIASDRIEAQAIAACLQDVPVTAPTSYFGRLGAGGGAVELAASVQALQNDRVPVTLNYETPDPACPINVVQGKPLARRQDAALVLSQARTGQAASLLLRKA